jgi:hypothetical protein
MGERTRRFQENNNMELTDVALLEYLHDAVVLGICYRAEEVDCREILLKVVCDRESGYPAWDGKRLCIRLRDVMVVNHYVFGAVTSQEQINTWGTRLSPSMEADIQRIRSTGINCGGIAFSLTFHTGSLLEGMCRQVFVELDHV